MPKRIQTRLASIANLLTLATVALPTVLIATGAEARLMRAELPVPTGSVHEAVHLPTGCISRVHLDEQKVVTASITDPHCLPNSIVSQPIPAIRTDFELIPNPMLR
jgi:hypothetical protein